MNKTFLLALVLTVSAHAQNNSSLSFDLKGLSPTDTLILQWGANNKSMNPLIGKKGISDQSPFVIPLDEPRLIVLSLKGYQGNYELLISPGEDVVLNGRVKKEDEAKNQTASFRRMHVKGATMQEEYLGIIQSYQQHQDSIDLSVFNEYKDVYRLI